MITGGTKSAGAAEVIEKDERGVVEAFKIPIRDPAFPPVADSEFIRLASDGHELGVTSFLESEAGAGRVDGPRGDGVSCGGGGNWNEGWGGCGIWVALGNSHH